MEKEFTKIRVPVFLIQMLSLLYKPVQTPGISRVTTKGVFQNHGYVTEMMIVWTTVMKNKIVQVSKFRNTIVSKK